MGQNENIKPKNNTYRRRKSTPTQKHRKFIQQNYRKKTYPNLKYDMFRKLTVH